MDTEKRKTPKGSLIAFGLIGAALAALMPYAILTLAFVCLFIIGTTNFIARCNTPKRLTPPPERKPLPPPAPSAPRVPTLTERMEAVGIHQATIYDTPGDGYGLSVESVRTPDGGTTWCPFAMRSAHWRGKLFFVTFEHLKLTRGDRSWFVMRPDGCGMRHLYGLYEIVKAPVPPGEVDQGWHEPRRIASFCRTHLRLDDKVDESYALGELWRDCPDMTTLVERLEGPEAKRALKQAGLACVERDLADVEGRRGALQMERMRLQDELGILKGPPDRDRFPDDPRRAAHDAPTDDPT